MNKKEFLSRLEGLLMDLSKEERRDILYDYEEHFRLGLEAGKSEEEIADALGKPEDLVRDFIENYQRESQQGNRKPGFFNYIEEIINLGEHKSYEINEKDNYKINDIQNIDVSSRSTSVKIHNTSSDEIVIHLNGRVETNGAREPKLQTSLINGNLSIQIVRKNYITIGWNKEKLKLDIYLPNSFTKNLSINTTSGGVTGEQLNLERLYVECTSGSMELETIKAERSRLMGTSGNIKLSGFTGELEATTTSGSIKIDTVNSTKGFLKASSGSIKVYGFKGELTATTNSGTLVMESIKSTKTSLRSSSGSIKLSNILIGDLQAETNSGSIKIDSAETQRNSLISTSGKIYLVDFSGDLIADTISGKIQVEYSNFKNQANLTANSGSINLTMPPDAKFEVKATTGSGRISIDFPIEMSYGSQRSVVGVVGSNEYKINAQTTSGSIKIGQ